MIMKYSMKRVVLSFLILFCCAVSTASAITVEKLTLLARQPQVFAGNLRHAFNSTTGSTLVIWDRNNGTASKHSVWGRLIGPDGTPSGKTLRIVKGPNAQFADLTYNTDNNQFLLVYANETNGTGRFELFAQKLSAIGKKIGKPVRISPASDRGQAINNYAPRTLYDAATGSYLILWRRYALAQGVGISDGLYGLALNPDLTERKAPVLMAPLKGDFTNVLGPFIADIGLHPTNGKVLITGWTQSTQPGFSVQYFLSRFDPALKKPAIKLKNLKPDLSSGAAPHSQLVFLPANNSQVLFVEGTGVRKRRINGKGAPTGAHSLFFTGAVETAPLEFPVAALATDNGRAETAIVAIDDSSTQTGKLWLQTAGATGSAVGQPFELQSNLDITQRPAIFALPNHPPAGFFYAVIYVDGVRSNPPTPNDSSGLVLLKVNTSP